MKELKNSFLKAKTVLQKKKEGQVWINRQITAVIIREYGEEKAGEFLKNFHLKNQTLFIEAKNKAAAQELFWRKEELKKAINFPKKVIAEIIVR